MRMTSSRLFLSSSSGTSAAGASPVPTSQPSTAHTWQTVHNIITDSILPPNLPDDLFGYTLYQYTVYDAFRQQPDAAAAQRMFSRLLTYFEQQTFTQWTEKQLNQAGILAWLYARFTAEGLENPMAQMVLDRTDQALQQEALALLTEPAAADRSNFVRVMRYFSLRLPDPGATACLRPILSHQAEQPAAFDYLTPQTPAAGEPVSLGLANGLAAELLVFINLYKAGIQDFYIRQYVRQGILGLLAVRREVDFLEQRYSVFPDAIAPHSFEPLFGAEMSWQRGDLGQSLLLYEAQQLLHDAELANIAELVGLNTLLRTTSQSTQIASSQFYRGASGVAHLYRKLYQVSRQPAYHDGYEFWLGQTQQWLHQELAAGFYQPRGGDIPQGLAGVGLVLLSAVTPQPLSWDKAIL